MAKCPRNFPPLGQAFSPEDSQDRAFRYGIAGDFVTDTDTVRKLAGETALYFILKNQGNKFLKDFISLPTEFEEMVLWKKV